MRENKNPFFGVAKVISRVTGSASGTNLIIKKRKFGSQSLRRATKSTSKHGRSSHCFEDNYII